LEFSSDFFTNSFFNHECQTLMCGRFTLRSRLNLLLQQFALDSHEDRDLLDPRYNIAPTQDVLAVRSRAAGQRELARFRWGLVPSWANDLKTGARMINARAETIASKPSFTAAFKRRRCLIPGDGFYEWRKTGQAKQPYLIELADGGLFGFAGLWESWQPERGPTIESCTIITTAANNLMRELHERMPVILSPRDYEAWLDPDNSDCDGLLKRLDAYPGDHMRTTPVKSFVNHVRNQGPECVEPLDSGLAE
jgi:putative SOS response-associated peptidase YedK